MSDQPPSRQDAPTDRSDPVTTIVRRRVRPDKRSDYETWLHDLLDRARTDAPGFLGAEIHPPPRDATDPVYTSVFRFGSLADRDRFERSDLRRDALREVQPLVLGDAAWDTHTGLEFWFDPPPGTAIPQPVRWRMALVLGVVVYLLVLIFGTVAAATIGDLPAPLRLAIVIAVEITIMTYVLLPRITRALSNWIYPRRTTA